MGFMHPVAYVVFKMLVRAPIALKVPARLSRRD